MLKKLIPGALFFYLLILSINTVRAQSEHRIQLGAEILPGDDNTSGRFQVVNYITISPWFSAGAGAGFTYYNDPLSLLPVFAELTYALTPGRTTPYIVLRAGYNFSILTDTDILVDDHHGGVMLNPGVGLKVMTRDGLGLHLSVGYSLDKSQLKVEENDSRTVKTDITYRRLMAGFGLSF